MKKDLEIQWNGRRSKVTSLDGNFRFDKIGNFLWSDLLNKLVFLWYILIKFLDILPRNLDGTPEHPPWQH